MWINLNGATPTEKMLWCQDGLRFSCVRCGSCCCGEPGTIAVSDSDIDKLCVYLGLPRKAFLEIYVYLLPDGTASLREKANGDCIFFRNGNECLIYEHRPRQCRTWPFWRAIVRSPQNWNKHAACCAGMNQGRLFTAPVIKKISENDGVYSSILRYKNREGVENDI